MNGLTQIKDKDEILYDVQYDCDLQRFIVWEHDKLTVDGYYFTSEEMNYYIKDRQIQIIKDDNCVFKKHLI